MFLCFLVDSVILPNIYYFFMTSISSLYQIYLNHPTICTDTRNITEGCLFFALKGDRFDANTLASTALLSGAAYAVIDNAEYLLDDRYILVDDTLSTLQELAKFHRGQISIPVIGLTGTNGKTTTKELINAVLSSKYKTFATSGNLNNHIGVPLSILSITPETEIAVIEMGANHQKEIGFLCSIAQPTHGLITNVGLAHLEGFGGFEGVKKGKGELYTYLKHHAGTVFVNSGNDHLLEMCKVSELNNIIWYGTNPEDYVQGELINADPVLEISWNRNSLSYRTTVNLTGAYNFENILAAICLGSFFDVEEKSIISGLNGYIPKNNRSQIFKTPNNTIICDFYNANPSSMSAALKNLSELSSTHKMVILGDMFELGNESAAQHDLIAQEAQALMPDKLLLVGKEFYSLRDKYKAMFFNTPAEAADYLSANPVQDFMVLLKGSRGMALEKLLPLL
jgi:UDP-N-acetylmuramoyl-tripeptide--D-alanyl-D-alanine ligase